jgi:hypothetical protein
MSTMRTRFAVAMGALVVAAASARGQGNLSTQGLGFPPGQLSTRAQSMGGSTGESDALSALNPASLSLLLTSMIAMQAEPEYREVSLGGVKQKTSVARFPLFMGAMPVGPRWMVGVSASTLFDRTWSTTSRDTQVVGTDTIASTIGQLSEGAIIDLRLAAAYTIRSWLRVGVGGHAYSGQTAMRAIRAFDDTASFASDTQTTSIGYGGSALSVGMQLVWPKWGTLGMSYRRGGTLSTYAGANITQTSSAPDHFGVSVIYLGIEGTTFAFRAARDAWSNSASLSSTMTVHEGWDTGLGVDVQGPRFGASPMSIRAGARWRTLPFSSGPEAVTERTLSGGFGFPLARGRSEFNIGLLRAARGGYSGASENAWTLSTGFSVRP